MPWFAGIAVVALIAVGGYFGLNVMRQRSSGDGNEALRRGVELWQRGRPAEAAPLFAAAARELPSSALPHVYLSRMARERGDLSAAIGGAARAVRLEPQNPLALREMATVLLARGDNDGARRFYVRAIRVQPNDRVAMGWLACAFQRSGDIQQAARWAARAGTGPWSSCLR